MLQEEETLHFENYQLNASVLLRIHWNQERPLSPAITLICSDEGKVTSDFIQITGLQGNISLLPTLPLGTKPGQVLHMESINLDPLQFTDGSIHFGYMDEILYLEQIKAKLFEGSVHVTSFQYPHVKDKALETTLYFNQIPVQPLLDAYNTTQIKVSGSLVGRIPLTWKPPRLHFNDGLLFTEPGGGRFQMIETQLHLENAVPAGYANEAHMKKQLAMASIALQDLHYEYIQLKVGGTPEHSICSFKIMEQVNSNDPHPPLRPPLDLTLNTEGLFSKAIALALNLSMWEEILKNSLSPNS